MSARNRMPGTGEGRLFSLPGALLAIVAAALLCWPMLFVSAPIGYFDTLAYLDTGKAGFSMLWEVLDRAPAVLEETPLRASGEGREASAMRSAVYSLYLAGFAVLPAGLVLATLLQSASVLIVLFALLDGWRL